MVELSLKDRSTLVTQSLLCRLQIKLSSSPSEPQISQKWNLEQPLKSTQLRRYLQTVKLKVPGSRMKPLFLSLRTFQAQNSLLAVAVVLKMERISNYSTNSPLLQAARTVRLGPQEPPQMLVSCQTTCKLAKPAKLLLLTFILLLESAVQSSISQV